ncbi:MAG: hypothetical protein ACYDAY_08795 [Candidatus Dormibacteria bacterium]
MITRPRVAALIGAVGMLASGAGSVHAAGFDTSLCPDPAEAISGTGSSFQYNQVQSWINDYNGLCLAAAGSVSYSKTGSGAGINGMIARTTQFAGSDVPYSDAQWVQIQAGVNQSGTNIPSKAPGGVSTLETLPIALGAVTVPYNLSDCPDADASAPASRRNARWCVRLRARAAARPSRTRRRRRVCTPWWR